MPNHRSWCTVTQTTAQSIPSGADTLITFNTITQGKLATGYTLNSNRVQVPVNGHYRVTGMISFIANDVGQRVATIGTVNQNGNGANKTSSASMESSSAGLTTVVVDDIVQITDRTSQFFCLWAYHAHTANLNTSVSPARYGSNIIIEYIQ